MRFFKEAPEGTPFWHRHLAPPGIAFSILVVLGQVWLIAYLALGAAPNIDWLAIGLPLALTGIGLIVWAVLGERRAEREHATLVPLDPQPRIEQ